MRARPCCLLVLLLALPLTGCFDFMRGGDTKSKTGMQTKMNYMNWDRPYTRSNKTADAEGFATGNNSDAVSDSTLSNELNKMSLPSPY